MNIGYAIFKMLCVSVLIILLGLKGASMLGVLCKSELSVFGTDVGCSSMFILSADSVFSRRVSLSLCSPALSTIVSVTFPDLFSNLAA